MALLKTPDASPEEFLEVPFYKLKMWLPVFLMSCEFYHGSQSSGSVSPEVVGFTYS
ncbi:MAG: hypothetical protein SH856_04865 [Flavobacteriales bacterium]|nr:hypothetical protein [Flavobacteriales bacterium]